VAATDPAGGVVSPGGVGFDISCGVRLVRSELEAVGVKAATYHRLRLERGSGGWTADVYLDV
jgi:RNA-splicing ligase RtcB